MPACLTGRNTLSISPATTAAASILPGLVATWRAEAEALRRRYGLDQLATLCETHAAELEEALARSTGRLLTLPEASAESGYSVAHLRTLLASGALTQAGRRGAPRMLSTDLPHKPERQLAEEPAADPGSSFDARSAARAALSGTEPTRRGPRG
jgi:hypothetical protein